MSELRREDKTTKPDFTLIPYKQELRVVDRFQMGADKYARDDWMNATNDDRMSYYASIHRHLRQAQNGDTDEDHLAAVIVDAMILMHIEEQTPYTGHDPHEDTVCSGCFDDVAKKAGLK